MKLIEMTTGEYLDKLASATPAPGGGSASAVSGAQGLALLSMVCNLTIGKEKYKAYEEECKEALEAITELLDEMCAAIDKDTAAYNLVAEAYKMPKETEGRSEKIQKALIEATRVPFETMKLAATGIHKAEDIIGKTNPNAESDIGVAILNLRACLLGAWLNVKINLAGIKDEAVKENFTATGKEMLEEAEKMAMLLYAAVSRKI